MNNYILATLMAMAVVIVGYFFIYKTMPEYSLQQVEQAARQHDPEKFARFVDIEAISASLADQFLTYTAQEPASDTLISPQLEQTVTSYSKPQLNNAFKTVVVDYVQYGKHPSEAVQQAYKGDKSPADMLLRLQDAIVEKLTFRGFKTLNREDGYAHVAANFYTPDTNERLQLEFRMRDQGRHWQIVEVLNLEQFLRSISE